jgi:septal ring factor EnvC (AmiA/AmiB activator)
MLALPLSGCTVKANQEQLQMLDEARKRAESSEADQNACKQEQAKLQKELADRKALLAKLTNDRDVVKKALNQ